MLPCSCVTCCCIIIDACRYAVAYCYHLSTVAHVYSLEITMVIHIAKLWLWCCTGKRPIAAILHGQDILCHMGLRVLSIVSNAAANVTCYKAQMKLILTEACTG